MKNILRKITGESYWKERTIAIFMVVGLLAGNLVEILSGKEAKDSPVFWIIGVVIGSVVIVFSLLRNPKYKNLTSAAFKIFLFYLNFNVIYAYYTNANFTHINSPLPFEQFKE